MMFDDDRNYRPADFARLLFGWNAATFAKRRARLHATQGFPQPISSIGRPRWSGRALNAWRDREQSAVVTVDFTAPGNIHSLEDKLRNRARQIAGGKGRR